MSAPTWIASTAYVAGALISPTSGAGMYRAKNAGTSGNSEPVWATNGADTTDNTITWALATTWRQDLHAGILARCQAFVTANPTIARRVYHARPASYTSAELPCIVIGSLTEDILISNGVRQRTGRGSADLELVDRAPEGEEADDRMNLLVDGLVDWLTLDPHMASATSIVEPVGVVDAGNIAEGTNVYFVSNTLQLAFYVAVGRP